MERLHTGGSDRGQLLLIAAFMLAVLFVTLGLVLNTVVFTGNLASREATDGTRVTEARQQATAAYDSSVFFGNYYAHTSYGSMVELISERGQRWSGTAAHNYVSGGTVLDPTVVGTTNGTTIGQDDARAFTDVTDTKTSWTLVEGASGTRRFTMNVTGQNLASVGSVDDLAATNAFHVSVDGGAWEMYVYEKTEGEGEGDEEGGALPPGPVVTIIDGGEVYNYPVPQSAPFVIDLTEGTIAGEKVPQLDFPGASATAPYKIRYENGRYAHGRYVLVVDKPKDELAHASNFADACEDKDPYTAPAIYSATVSVTYRSEGVYQQASATAAPESHPWGRQPGPKAGHGPATGAPPAPGNGPTYAVRCRAIHRTVTFVSKVNQTLSTINHVGAKERIHWDGKPPEIGPALANLDGEGSIDIPFLSNGGSLVMIDMAGDETVHLVDSDQISDNPIAVGDYDGDAKPEIYYIGEQRKDFYKVSALSGQPENTNPVKVEGGDVDKLAHPPTSVGGVVDVTGDGSQDIIYVNNQKEVRYLSRSSGESGVLFTDAVSIGRPADFDGDGTLRIPAVRENVDGKPQIWLVPVDGSDPVKVNETFTKVAPAPITSSDINLDKRPDIVFVHKQAQLYYMTESGKVRPVKKKNGDTASANRNKGAK